MTGEQREVIRRERDRAVRWFYRQAYGPTWFNVQERVERELEDRSRMSYLDGLYGGHEADGVEGVPHGPGASPTPIGDEAPSYENVADGAHPEGSSEASLTQREAAGRSRLPRPYFALRATVCAERRNYTETRCQSTSTPGTSYTALSLRLQHELLRHRSYAI